MMGSNLQSNYRIGSLFSGYGGLDMATQAMLGGEVVWYSEIEKAACKVLEATHPDALNLGDITAVDWATVAPVDVLTGGYPCQPFSHAGKRKGAKDVRHLWPYVLEAIRHLRPRLVILENVRGHLTLGFANVLADLASVGFDARWGIVRASDAEAPHQRARLFIIAHPASEWSYGGGAGGNNGQAYVEAIQGKVGGSSSATPDSVRERHGSGERSAGVGSLGGTSEVIGRKASTTREKPRTGSIETATDTDSASSETRDDTRPDGERLRVEPVGSSTPPTDFGKYTPAVERWGHVIGRVAPSATVLGGKANKPRLNPVFVEWMMGLPQGHVTGHGLSAAQELKMLGNGVCPQQAMLALDMLL